MRDRKNDGGNKSLGYAFVSTERHDVALLVLRSLNNNPNAFLAEKRPIVEFCCENRKAIQAQERRKERFENRKRLENVDDNSQSSSTAKKSKNKDKNKKDQKNKSKSSILDSKQDKIFSFQIGRAHV